MNQSGNRKPLFEVRHSPIHGYGVFALRRIRKGTRVVEYLGQRVTHAEADARYEDKHPKDNHTFLFTVDSRTVIDGGVGGNEARFINHGCDPNCESTTLNRRIYIEAIRTIQPGEELAYDYQIDRDRDDPPDVDQIFACRCGAAKCRGSMLVARKTARKSSAGKQPAKPARRAGSHGAERAERAGSHGAKRTGSRSAERAGTRSAKRTGSRGAKRTGSRSAERTDSRSAKRTDSRSAKRRRRAAAR